MPRTQSRQAGKFACALVFVLIAVGAIVSRCAGSDPVTVDSLTATGASLDPVDLWRTVAGAGGVLGCVVLLLLFRAWRTAVKAVDRLVGSIESFESVGGWQLHIVQLKKAIRRSGIGSDGYGDSAGWLIHKRVRRNDG